MAPMVSFDCGPHPANRVAFDPTGNCNAFILTHVLLNIFIFHSLLGKFLYMKF